MKLKEFFNPRYTTEEMEGSRTRYRARYEISAMDWADGKPGYPTIGVGKVFAKGKMEPVSWDQYGKCTRNGKREPQFDLVRKAQREIETGYLSAIGILGIVIVLAYIILSTYLNNLL